MSATTMPIAADLGQALATRGWKVVTAESCTGGLVAGAITDISGSSEWFDRGFVTYSNEAKVELLGVRPETLSAFGAVSEEAVREMVGGALARSGANIAVAVTGIAGPTGGTPQKPVGLVWLAWATAGSVVVASHYFPGDRAAVRDATVVAALEGLLEQVSLP